MRITRKLEWTLATLFLAGTAVWFASVIGTRPVDAALRQALPRVKPRTLDSAAYLLSRALSPIRDTTRTVIARVISVKPYTGAAAERIRKERQRSTSTEPPPVSGVTLQVIEVLDGAKAPSTIEVDNEAWMTRRRPVTPQTWRRQVGEVLLLQYDTAGLSSHPFAVCDQIVGPNDELLVEFRRNYAWRKRPDPVSACREARVLAANTQASALARIGALGTLAVVALRQAKQRDGESLLVTLQETITDILSRADSPVELARHAVGASRIDASLDMTLNSPGADTLSRLIHMVLTEQDTNLLRIVCSQLYNANIQSAVVDGTFTRIHFPQIVRALELRERTEALAGTTAIAAGTLHNLELVGSRTPVKVWPKEVTGGPALLERIIPGVAF